MSSPPRSLALVLALTSCPAGDKDSPTTDATTTSATTRASDTGDATTAPPAPTTGDTTTTAATTTTGEVTTTAADTTSTTTGAAAPSFTEIYEQVILPNGCNAGYCHGGGAGGLEMTDEATTYANLVEVKAVAALCDQSMRVVPGAPDESILWIRARPAALDTMAACADGNKMPKTSMGLAADQAQLLSDWIAGGALE